MQRDGCALCSSHPGTAIPPPSPSDAHTAPSLPSTSRTATGSAARATQIPRTPETRCPAPVLRSKSRSSTADTDCATAPADAAAWHSTKIAACSALQASIALSTADAGVLPAQPGAAAPRNSPRAYRSAWPAAPKFALFRRKTLTLVQYRYQSYFCHSPSALTICVNANALPSPQQTRCTLARTNYTNASVPLR